MFRRGTSGNFLNKIACAGGAGVKIKMLAPGPTPGPALGPTPGPAPGHALGPTSGLTPGPALGPEH